MDKNTFKSRTTGEMIPTVIVEFHSLPNYWWTKEDWQSIGGYRGFMKFHSIGPKQIKKVHHLLKNPKDFPTEEWQG